MIDTSIRSNLRFGLAKPCAAGRFGGAGHRRVPDPGTQADRVQREMGSRVRHRLEEEVQGWDILWRGGSPGRH
eukprot:scaffold651465_cov47-Prasinocladus_malaysianus.AAC.1